MSRSSPLGEAALFDLALLEIGGQPNMPPECAPAIGERIITVANALSEDEKAIIVNTIVKWRGRINA